MPLNTTNPMGCCVLSRKNLPTQPISIHTEKRQSLTIGRPSTSGLSPLYYQCLISMRTVRTFVATGDPFLGGFYMDARVDPYPWFVGRSLQGCDTREPTVTPCLLVSSHRMLGTQRRSSLTCHGYYIDILGLYSQVLGNISNGSLRWNV